MRNVFSSRGEARQYAKENGGKVVDRGSDQEFFRWMVVPKNSIGSIVVAKKAQTKEKKITSEVIQDFVAKEIEESVPITSRFFASRGEARDFAKAKKNANLIDHASTGRFVHNDIVRDLGKQGKRWEVVYQSDSDTSVTVPDLPPVEDVIATKEDMKVYNKIANDYDMYAIHEAVQQEIVANKEPVVVMTPGNVCISTPDGSQHTINRDNPIFPDVGLLLIQGDIDAAIALIKQGIEAKAEVAIDLGPDLKLLDGILYWHGQKQESTIAKRIVKDIEEGNFDERYVKFMQKLMHNPSFASVKMLYDFMQHNDLEILENGNVKAYKKIKKTADGPRDSHTGKVPNYKGQVITMPRNMVEDNPSKTCSQGLHIASLEYAGGFSGNSLIEVAVHPADVVSVPYDYNQQKCRCCRYEVLTGTEKPSGAPDVLVIGSGGDILDEIYLTDEETKED